MIDGKKVLGIIPARGGSKGLPRKNVRMLAGKPLIGWTIEAALLSRYIDRLILSSDNQAIIDTAVSFGCEVPFVRPAELAQDDTPGIVPILHALEQLPGYDIVVVLQPTSPLRSVADIDGCLDFSTRESAAVCVSVTLASKSPEWMFTMDENHRLKSFCRSENLPSKRQDLSASFTPNGALFVGLVDYLKSRKSFYTDNTLGYVMPKERSLDIDDEVDFLVCECLLSGHKGENF